MGRILTENEALERVERRRTYQREYMRKYAKTAQGREAITRARLRTALRHAGLSESEVDRLTAERMAAMAEARDRAGGVGGDES